MRVNLRILKRLFLPVFLIFLFGLPANLFAARSHMEDIQMMEKFIDEALALASKNAPGEEVEEGQHLGAPPVEELLPLGKKTFFRRCVWCHGVKGAGDGPSAKLLVTNPRNFLSGMFKIRQSDSGELPFEADLVRTVTTGLPGSAMPAWGGVLSAKEIAAVIQFVKTLVVDRDFADEDEEVFQQELGGTNFENPWGLKAPYYVGAPDDDIKKGHALFIKNKCFECHGGLGRGDGNPTMKDDWGFAIVAANWQQCWNFRGSRRNPYTPFNIVRDVSTGLNGTPMPNFKDALEVEQRWQLAAFVNSICPRREIDPMTQKPKTDPYVVATYTKGKISHDPDDPQWQGSYDDKRIPEAARDKDYTNFPWKPKGTVHHAYIAASGQLSAGKRNFPSQIDNFWVSARWSEEEKAVYVFVEYHNRFLGNSSPEGVAIEIAANPDGPRPGAVFGDAANAVNVWKASMKPVGYTETAQPKEEGYKFDAKVEDLVGNGYQSVKPGGSGTEVVFARFNRGKVSVLIKHPLDGTPLAVGKFVPMAILQWSARAKESGEVMSLTGWNNLVLEGPDGKIPDYKPPVVAAVDAGDGKNPFSAGASQDKMAFLDADADEFMKHVTNGGKAYFQNCHQCHGDQLNGLGMMSQSYTPAPSDIFVSHDKGEGALFKVISEGGGVNSEMPAFKDFLSKDQIWEVVTFLNWYTGGK